MPTFLLPLLLKLSPIVDIFKRVPAVVWEALAVIGYVLALIALHQHYANAAIADAKAEQKAADQKALDQTVAGYRAAAAKAQTDNQAQVQKVEQQYQRNSDNERQAYLDDIAKLRAGRVQPQGSTTPAHPGVSGSAGSPAPDPSTPRINEAGLCVPATSDVCEAGAEIEDRLMHLQNLYLQQVSVDPNKPPS